MKKASLKKFMYLSIVTALVTIGLKFYAYYLTKSMGLFSDALESFVNLFAAVIALTMIHISERPADEEHAFGHTKAEYFSSAIEGGLIVVAAFSIIYSAIPRLFNPQPLENVGAGLLVSLGASVINLVVAQILIKNGNKNHSLVLEADGKHLMTDVWTSVGVIIAILLVKLLGEKFIILDPVIAILVALNIIWTGYLLLKRSASGLLDASISEEEQKKIIDYLDTLSPKNIIYHSLMTRQAGQRKFISMHLLVPGAWTVQEGHDYCEEIENHIEDMFNVPVTVSTHLEPVEDPCSMNDIGIDRKKRKTE
ncbi:MAG: cation diffusion facilitator family transporter [Paludibacteraceae bacterium]